MPNDSSLQPLHQFDLIAGALNEQGLLEGTARLVSKSTASFTSEEIAQITLEGEFENGLFLSGTSTITFQDGTVNLLSGTFSLATERFTGTLTRQFLATQLLQTGVFFWNGELFDSLPEPTYYEEKLFDNNQLIEEREGLFLNNLLHGENGKETIYSVEIINDEPVTATETTTGCFREGLVVGKNKFVAVTMSATHKSIKTYELDAPFKIMEPFHGTCNDISFCKVNSEWVWELESTLLGEGLSTDGNTSIQLFNGKQTLISICNALNYDDSPCQNKLYQLEEKSGTFENLQLVEGEVAIYHTGSVKKTTKPTEDDLNTDKRLILREAGKFKDAKLIAGTKIRRADNNVYIHATGDWDYTTSRYVGQLIQISAESKIEYRGTFTCFSETELRMLPTASHYTCKEYTNQKLIREEEGNFLDWKLEGLGSRTEYHIAPLPHSGNTTLPGDKLTTKGIFHAGVATTVNMISLESRNNNLLINTFYTFTSNTDSLYTGRMLLQVKTANLVMLRRAMWTGTMRPMKEPGQFELIEGEATITTYENGQATDEQISRGDFEKPTRLHSLPSNKTPCQEEIWHLNGAERQLISRKTGTFIHGKFVVPPQETSVPLPKTVVTTNLKATVDELLQEEQIEKKRLREAKLAQKAEKERQADLVLHRKQEKNHEKQRVKTEEAQRLRNEKKQKQESEADRSKQLQTKQLATMDTIKTNDIDEVFEPGSIAMPYMRPPTPVLDWSAIEAEPYVFSSPIITQARCELTTQIEAQSHGQFSM